MTKEEILEGQEVRTLGRAERDAHKIDYLSFHGFYKSNLMTKTKIVTPPDI